MSQHRGRNKCHRQITIFIRPYHVKEEDKALINKEMKRLCYLGILKEGFSPYCSLVMLISRKLTRDKRVVTDFRHLNVRIAKNNLAYPSTQRYILSIGKFKMWGTISSRFKRCIPFIKTVRKFQEILLNTPLFW